MNRPAKLGRKKAVEALTQKPGVKPKPPRSRNPLKELNSCSLPSARSTDAPKRGCFGSLPSGSSSSSCASSSSIGSFPRSKSLPRTPRSAPPNSSTLRSVKNPGDSCLRSGVLPKNPSSRTRFESLQQVGTSNPQNPNTTGHLQRWNHSKAGSGGTFQKKNAEPRGHGAAMAKHQDLPVGVDLGVVNQESSTASIPGRRGPPPLVPQLGLERRGTPAAKISNWSILNATPSKDGEHQKQHTQHSHTPKSTGTATPPVHASISPEILGGQSMMPTPACFAAGHLLAGVQDRRKCRPRGILNGGAGGMEIEDNRRLTSLGDHGERCRASLTPPPMVEASMHWLSSPRDEECGTSSSTSRVHLKECPAEASVNWLLSPPEHATDEDAREIFPGSSSTLASNGASKYGNVFWSVDATGNSPEFKGLVSLTSFPHEDTSCAVGFCCSPSTDSSISPYSMILTKAAASASCKDLSPREDKERCCYCSSMDISPFSGDSKGGSNVVCTPSIPSSSRQIDSMSTLGLYTMAHTVETQISSSQALRSGSKHYLPLSALSFQFSHTSTPSNSVDLARFQMPLGHQTSVREDFPTGEEKLSYSDLRVSWREGLVSRIFDMDELDCCNQLSDEVENADCQAEDQMSSMLDLKLDLNSRRALSTSINEMDVTKLTNGLRSSDFVGIEKTEQQWRAKGPFGSWISYAESFSMEEDGVEASIDSDWSLFYRNNLFEV